MRGGYRQGAGRPKGTTKEPTVAYYRRVKPEWIEKLDYRLKYIKENEKMQLLQNSSINEENKENTFKFNYESLEDGERFEYDGFECKKINDKYFAAINYDFKFIIFDVFENCGSIGAYSVRTYNSYEDVLTRVQELNGEREHKH